MPADMRAQVIWWILRLAAAMCFVGHGAFGIITKEEWLPFFAWAGLSRGAAYTLMPLIGAMDIALGLAVLIRPSRAVFLYMTVWALWTAALRPLTGDSAFEMLERAGNYGVPFALLAWVGAARGWRGWFERVSLPAAGAEREALVPRVLVLTTVLLLVGHGGLALQGKPLLVAHAEAIGLTAAAVPIAGGFELVLAALVLLAPRPSLLVPVVAWKVATEWLFVVSGAPAWEFIERGGSYGAPLAIAAMTCAAWGRRVSARATLEGMPP